MSPEQNMQIRNFTIIYTETIFSRFFAALNTGRFIFC